MRRTITERASQLIVILIVLIPPLAVLIQGRNLNLVIDSVEALALERGAQVAIALLAAVVVIQCWNDRHGSGSGFIVMWGFLAYYVTNVILCVPFGEVIWIKLSHIVPLIVFVAIYLSRDDGPEAMINAGKWSLLFMMAASLVCGILLPEATRMVYAPEVRLPFIDFRFWGLASHANTFATMALLLALLTLHRPFQRSALTLFSLVCSGLGVLLAQSQAVWLIGPIIITGYLMLRYPFLRARILGIVRSPLLFAPVLIFVITASIGIALIGFAAPVVVEDASFTQTTDDVLTGRGIVWAYAIELFERYPLFGYGLGAWERELNPTMRVMWAATHAHNQFLQSLSVAGISGVIGLLIYVGALVLAAVRTTAATRGLAPALLALVLGRSITEVPFSLNYILEADIVVHLLLFRMLTSPQLIDAPRLAVGGAMYPQSLSTAAPRTGTGPDVCKT